MNFREKYLFTKLYIQVMYKNTTPSDEMLKKTRDDIQPKNQHIVDSILKKDWIPTGPVLTWVKCFLKYDPSFDIH